MEVAPAFAEGGEKRRKLAALLGALSHPTRLAILEYLARAEQACCCKDVVGSLDLAQSTVSQHLRILVDAGLVRYTPDRQRSIYEVDRAALDGLARAIDRLVTTCCAVPGSVSCKDFSGIS